MIHCVYENIFSSKSLNIKIGQQYQMILRDYNDIAEITNSNNNVDLRRTLVLFK